MAMRLTLVGATLRRHPARTILAIAGIAVSAALLLDMTMLATGMSDSFRSLLLARGYQLRVSPKGTLPFDSEATIDGAGAIVSALRASPEIVAVSPVLGATLSIEGIGIPSSFALGIEPDVQGDYTLERGDDVASSTPFVSSPSSPSSNSSPSSSSSSSSSSSVSTAPMRIVVSETLLRRGGVRIGDTITLAAGLDAQLRAAARSRRAIVSGAARFLYIPTETPVLALPIAELRALLGTAFSDRVSLVMAEARRPDSASVEATRAWIARTQPRVTAISTETALRQIEQRLSYFRQLAFVLGAISLAIGFFLVTTLVTLSVNERRGEIAVFRAIGTSRASVLATTVLEGLALSVCGITAGLALGIVTAEWLNTILRDFPGLPAAFDFFVWSAGATYRAMGMLIVTGALAGMIPAWRAASVPIARALREEAVG